ncbi:MAG TPA: hypothetical protein VNN76_06270 [Bacteroidota bacterium]|nr:hypothetical protein [Bacteroidota bacterium]
MSIYHESKGSPVLKAIIVVLLGVLLYVLYEPYQVREREENYKKESRLRMMNIRTAQLQYISEKGVYANSLDTLVAFVKEKLAAGAIDPSIFKPLSHGAFTPDSLLKTPKSQRPYSLQTVEQTVIKKYLLEDPDGYGSIGSLTDDTRVNKASWEE